MTPPSDREDLSIRCPVCQGTMELVYDRPSQKVCVCVDCHSGITIPVGAWEVQQAKHGRNHKLDK
jgi:hypothetical protein